MSEKIFFHLLILCGIWSQGITGTFADEEIKQSSDLLVRQKRVVSYLEGEDIPVRILEAPHVVRIKEFGRLKCAGSILSQHVVITSSPCISVNAPEQYQVISSAAHLNNGNDHNVTEIRRRLEGPEPHDRSFDGIALLIVHPSFVYTIYCRPIKLQTGPVLVGSFGKVYGWGYNFRSKNQGTDIAKSLRSIEVPVISHQNCVTRYRPHREISEKTICTYHSQRHSGHIDFGAGLIIGEHLAGIFLWSGLAREIDPRFPDVYANLRDTYYEQWISINVQTIALRNRNNNHG